MQPQGWYLDPYGAHDERWYSDGKPTNLVRDQGTEAYDEPPRDRLSPYSRGRPAGEQLPSARAGREWRSWTVWLPGLLPLAPLCYLLSVGGRIGLLVVPVIALLASGLRKPEWREPVAAILWVASAFSYWVWAIAEALGSLT
jgi:hypothetical protein